MKKWSKLVLATMLSVGTLLVSGCIENIEPEGIADLRGAKAELLRAQVALQAAQAAKLEADAALVLAQAKVQEAIAKQEEARVKYVEAQALAEQYKAEYQKLVNDAYAQEQDDAHQKRVIELENLIAAQEAAMAAAENAAALAAEEFKIDMLDVTQRLAEAQLAYDQALLDIEVAKKTLTEDQQEYLTAKVSAVLMMKQEVEDLTEALEDAADDLAEAAAELDEPKANRVAIKRLERAVVTATAAWEAAQEAEAEALALLELDPMVTDWAAQLEKLEEDQKALEKERDAKAVEAADRAKVWRDSIDVLDEAALEYENYTGYTFNDETGYFSKVRGYVASSIDIPEVVVKAPLDSDGNPLFGGDFVISNETYEYGDEADVVEIFEQKLKELNTWSNASYEAQIETYQESIKNIEASQSYDVAMARYTDAVAAYNAGDPLAYFTKYVYIPDNGYADDFTVKGLFDEYNAAIKALKDAIGKYDTEWAKYSPDWTAKYEAINKTYEDAVAAADAKRAAEKQKAEDARTKALVAWTKAENVYAQATTTFNAAIAAAESTAGVDETSMRSAIETYELLVGGGATLDEDQQAEYDKYVACIAIIDKARLAYNSDESENDATDVYNKASDAREKAIGYDYEDYRGGEYGEAIEKAESDYLAVAGIYEEDGIDGTATVAWKNATEELDAEYPQINSENEEYLWSMVTSAGSNLSALVGNIENAVSYSLIDCRNTYYVDYKTESGRGYRVYFPDYLVKITNDPVTNKKVYSEVEASVADVVDKEFFLENTIAPMADELLYDYVVYGYDSSWNQLFWEQYSILGEYEGYPLELPTYEMYAEAVDGVDLEIAANARYNELVSRAESEGHTVLSGYYYVNTSSYNQLLRYQIEIADLEAVMAYIALVPDFVAAIEAAKAEFEAYAAEKAAEIEALKADVEANYPRLLAELEDVEAEADAFEAKVDAFDETRTALEQLISQYCDEYTDVEEFVAELEEAYEAAVQATLDAEEDVLEAEKALQDLQEGLVTAVELAQKAFDKATEDLENAQKLLDFAVEELDEAIALIYGEEETPAA